MATGIFDDLEKAEKRAAEAKVEAKRLANAIQSVMATPQGRLTVSWILSLTGQNDSLSSSDAMLMSNLSGRRDVGLQVLRKLRDVCPVLVDTMFVEERDGRRSCNDNRHDGS